MIIKAIVSDQRLARVLHQEPEFWVRDERFRSGDGLKGIALAMGESMEDECPVDPRLDDRIVQGWTILAHPACQESQAQIGAESSKMELHN